MSLMSKLLSTTLLATLSLSAATNKEDVTNYIKNYMIDNPQVKVSEVDVISTQVLDEPKGWEVFFVNIHANVKKSPTMFDKVTVPETLFVKDGVVAPSLMDIKTGKDYKAELKPELSSDIYNDKHLIAGDKDAKHKIVVFSDPQCPFCQEVVPVLYEDVKANPKTLALYYYHMPLIRIHPVSDILTRVMMVEQARGNMDNAIKMYGLDINPRELNVTKVLAKIEKDLGLKYKEEELDTSAIQEEVKFDREMTTKSLVTGTPTVYLDGKWDKNRIGYKELISTTSKSDTNETTTAKQ